MSSSAHGVIPVCATELGVTAKIKTESEKRKAKVIAASIDPVDMHLKWIHGKK